MIQTSIRIVAPAERRDDLVRALMLLRGPTEAARGCRYCRVLYDADDDRVLFFVEQWETQGDLEEHLRSERHRRLLPLMEMSAARPEVEFATVSSVQGLDYWLSLLSAEPER